MKLSDCEKAVKHNTRINLLDALIAGEQIGLTPDKDRYGRPSLWLSGETMVAIKIALIAERQRIVDDMTALGVERESIP